MSDAFLCTIEERQTAVNWLNKNTGKLYSVVHPLAISLGEEFRKAKDQKIELYESALKLIAFPKIQKKYTPCKLARHALRIEPLKP